MGIRNNFLSIRHTKKKKRQLQRFCIIPNPVSDCEKKIDWELALLRTSVCNEPDVSPIGKCVAIRLTLEYTKRVADFKYFWSSDFRGRLPKVIDNFTICTENLPFC